MSEIEFLMIPPKSKAFVYGARGRLYIECPVHSWKNPCPVKKHPEIDKPEIERRRFSHITFYM